MWTVQRLQAYKYEILPNGEQQRRMRRFAGSCRFVFNKALALQKLRYERGEKKLGYVGLCKLLTQWRNGTETPWVADAPTHPLQQALKDLERKADFLSKNPNGRVPLLEFEDGRSLSESDAILWYLSEDTSLLPVDRWGRAEVLPCLHTLRGGRRIRSCCLSGSRRMAQAGCERASPCAARSGLVMSPAINTPRFTAIGTTKSNNRNWPARVSAPSGPIRISGSPANRAYLPPLKLWPDRARGQHPPASL